MSAKEVKETKKTSDEVADIVTAEQQSAAQNPIPTHVSKTDLEISRLVQTQDESFPDPSDIQMDQPWLDPFKLPKWCDVEKYEYGWASVHDQVQLDAAINGGYWRIVNRSNHYSAPYQDFHHTHGAIERRGMILMYRPQEIAKKVRDIPVQIHRERAQALEEGKVLDGASLSMSKTADDSAPKAKDIAAFEEAGKEGLNINPDLLSL